LRASNFRRRSSRWLLGSEAKWRPGHARRQHQGMPRQAAAPRGVGLQRPLESCGSQAQLHCAKKTIRQLHPKRHLDIWKKSLGKSKTQRAELELRQRAVAFIQEWLLAPGIAFLRGSTTGSGVEPKKSMQVNHEYGFVTLATGNPMSLRMFQSEVRASYSFRSLTVGRMEGLYLP
jgi:hypothetical protein